MDKRVINTTVTGVIVCFGCITILACVWNPYHATLDYDKLARIMYLYDPEACEIGYQEAASVASLHLSNNTKGFNVLPIKWAQAISTVSTRLSSTTRKYIEASIVVHIIWMLSAMSMIVFAKPKWDHRVIKTVLVIFFYISLSIIFLDVSMGIVYVAHIRQSLSKGMIISNCLHDIKLADPELSTGATTR